MKFIEIFNEKGLYRAEGFAEGYCFEVDGDGFLSSLQYKHKDDLLPVRDHAPISRSLVNKEFTKVFTRHSLFTSET